MKTLMRVTLGLLLALALTPVLAQDQSNPVSVDIESYIVSEVTGDDGNTEERFTPANTARPGQVVEYRITATNNGETTLPAGTVVVTGPVPDSTHYLDGSATPSSEQVLTEYAGGGEFGEPPILADGEMVEPEGYTAVRWTLLTTLEPGESQTFIYRVVVE